MIQDTQEYLQHWEKENNPFYPSEMKWDRLQVNRFLKDYKQQLILPDVVGSLITAYDEGTYFVVNTDQLDEIEKGSVVYLLNTYPEDIHLFQDKNGDDVWIDADDVDRKESLYYLQLICVCHVANRKTINF